MDYHFKILQIARENYIRAIEGLSIEALNHVPTNFNNNIVWNFAHVIVTQQLLCYGLSDLPMNVPNEIIAQFRKGTKPTSFVTANLVEELKTLALQLVDKTKIDYENGIFHTFSPYKTSFNLTLNSFEEAIIFNNVHEGLHLGSVFALKKLV